MVGLEGTRLVYRFSLVCFKVQNAHKTCQIARQPERLRQDKTREPARDGLVIQEEGGGSCYKL